MRSWTPERVAQAAGARLIASPPTVDGPERATIDSRDAGRGALFIGLRGERTDGGRYAPQALTNGAWGVLVSPEYAAAPDAPGVVLEADDPLKALQRLATAWRRELDVAVIGVTGSTGKTSTRRSSPRTAAPSRLAPTSTPRSGSHSKSSTRRRARRR
jgi:UDP-N-acetylmuramoyl-tripeptide--D-alanyl-D-alanine ligase